MPEILPAEIEDIFICLSHSSVAFAKDEVFTLSLILSIILVITFVVISKSQRENKYKYYLTVIIFSCIIFLSIFLIFSQGYLSEKSDYERKCREIITLM
jgi:hypothetical protein